MINKKWLFCGLLFCVVFALLISNKYVPKNKSKHNYTISSDEEVTFLSNFVKNVFGYNHGKKKILKFYDDSHHPHDDTQIADALKEKVRVLCWIMTFPENHESRAIHILATWGKRCNKIFFSTESNHDLYDLPIILVNITSGRDHLTAKTMQTFDYLYKHHLNEYDWFLKADDDTYVIMENLRYFLSSQNPESPVFFGDHFQLYIKQGYLSGGAGYVLSKEALKRFGERSKNLCANDKGDEDVEIGKCMQALGVIPGDSRDALGRSRFHCFDPDTFIQGSYPEWYKVHSYYGANQGPESMSDYAITFHYVPINLMYAIEFFLYHIRLYGVISGNQKLNRIPDKPIASFKRSDTVSLVYPKKSASINSTNWFDKVSPVTKNPRIPHSMVADKKDYFNSTMKKTKKYHNLQKSITS